MKEALKLADVSKSETIPTNLRLLMILEDVARAGTPVTPSEVNERLGLPKPTIHRLFSTLEMEGFLQRELDGRSYTVGGRLQTLSSNALSSMWVHTARTTVLTKLASEVGETCNLSVPDRDAMIYLDRVETKWPLRIQLPVGSRVPLYCTASGKMYLSTLQGSHLNRYLESADLSARTNNTITDPEKLREELAETRKRGHSQDAEEFMSGMVAMAVPVLNKEDRLVSTLSFHAPVQRLSLEAAREHLDRLRGAAEELRLLLINGG